MSCNFISKISIGSAQFGQNYGITNCSGKTKYQEVIKILNLAKKNQIDSIDTAISYGNSEKVLGKAGISDFNIVTKLPSLKNIQSNYFSTLKEMLNRSMDRLKINKLECVLLHRPEDLIESRARDITEALSKLKEKNITKNIGLSIYSPIILDKIDYLSELDVIQSPLNVFDRRIIDSGWLKRLKDKNIAFHARSVFLQGLLLSDISKLPKYFFPWKLDFIRWENFVKDLGVSKLSGALKYVLELDKVDKVILGCENVDQFSEILKQARDISKYSSEHCGLSSSDERLINPIEWKYL